MGTSQSSLSLAEFCDNTSDLVKQVAQRSEPVLIEPADGPSVVLQNAESYNQLLDRLEHLEFVEAIRESMKDVEEGRVYPAREALAELQKKLGIPD